MNYEIFAMPFDHVINIQHIQNKISKNFKKKFINSPTSFSSVPYILYSKDMTKKEEGKEGGKVMQFTIHVTEKRAQNLILI